MYYLLPRHRVCDAALACPACPQDGAACRLSKLLHTQCLHGSGEGTPHWPSRPEQCTPLSDTQSGTCFEWLAAILSMLEL